MSILKHILVERRDQLAPGGISGFWLSEAASGEAALNVEMMLCPLREGEIMIARSIETAPVRKGREALEELVEETVMELPGVPQEELMARLEEKRIEQGRKWGGLGVDGFRMSCAEALRDLRDKGRVARGPLGSPPRWWPLQEGGLDS
jgi:hypothetical protein